MYNDQQNRVSTVFPSDSGELKEYYAFCMASWEIPLDWDFYNVWGETPEGKAWVRTQNQRQIRRFSESTPEFFAVIMDHGYGIVG